jgi:hypothetical protein
MEGRSIVNGIFTVAAALLALLIVILWAATLMLSIPVEFVKRLFRR